MHTTHASPTIGQATDAYCQGLHDAAERCTEMIAAHSFTADPCVINLLFSVRQWCWEKIDAARK